MEIIVQVSCQNREQRSGVFDNGRQFHRLLCLYRQVTDIIFFIYPKSVDTRVNPGIRRSTHASVSIQFKAKVNRSQDENHSGFQSVSEKIQIGGMSFRNGLRHDLLKIKTIRNLAHVYGE